MGLRTKIAERLYGHFYSLGRRRYDQWLEANAGTLFWPKEVEIRDTVYFYVLRVGNNAMGDLAACGIREPYSTFHFYDQLRLLRPELHVDIGANFGYYASIASRFSPVVAYEPLEEVIPYLSANLNYNGVYGYKIHSVAVYPTDTGYVNFHVAEKNNLSRVSDDGVPVPAVSPESVIPGVSPWTLRMDIEGSEREVLSEVMTEASGVGNLPAYVFVEYHPNLIGIGEVRRLDFLMRDLGYLPTYYFEPVPEVMCFSGWKVLEKLGYVGRWDGDALEEASRRNWVLHAHYMLPFDQIKRVPAPQVDQIEVVITVPSVV